MKMPENELIVLDVAGSHARLNLGSSGQEAELVAMGFVRQGSQMVRSITDSADRQQLVCRLIELDGVFSEGPDWSPAALVGLYKEQGVVTTGFRIITWMNPDQYEISSHN